MDGYVPTLGRPSLLISSNFLVQMIYLRWLWDAWLVGPRLVDSRVY